MPEQLMNTTAIWLLSLALYLLLLRKEAFHGFNRAFLLGSFGAGLFIPMLPLTTLLNFLHLNHLSAIWESSVEYVTEKATSAQRQQTANAASSGLDWTKVLLSIYLTGLVFALALLLRDANRIYRLCKNGKLSQEKGYRLVVTGLQHAPFSFINCIFVTDMAAYTAQEWEMVVRHELRHKQLWHWLDIWLLQLAGILFWFHPLVYVYRRNLQLVHEYQADCIAGADQHDYIQFLITQTMMHKAPALVHSFHHSPLKNRIFMLKQTTSFVSLTKKMIALPLLLLIIIYFAPNAFAQNFVRKGNTITYKGNTFEVTPAKKDTVLLTDPVSGKETQKIAMIPETAMKMNGRKIYDYTAVDVPPMLPKKNKQTAREDDLANNILSYLVTNSTGLPAGDYRFNLENVVIGPDGEVVLFEIMDINNLARNLSARSKETIKSTVAKYLAHQPKMVPAQVEGVAVPCHIRMDQPLAFTLKRK